MKRGVAEMPRNLLPHPWVMLNFPKTGTRFVQAFTQKADILEVLSLLSMKQGARFLSKCLHHCVDASAFLSSLRRAKKKKYSDTPATLHKLLTCARAYGNMTLTVHHHTEYALLPPKLRKYHTVIGFRDPLDWYVSYITFFKWEMDFLLLPQCDYLLSSGLVKKPLRNYFIEKYLNGKVSPANIRSLSYEGSLFWHQEIRLPYYIMKRTGWGKGKYLRQLNMPYMMALYFTYLHLKPTDVLEKSPAALKSWIDSGRFRQEISSIFFINHRYLRETLKQLLVEQFGYRKTIVDAVAAELKNQNVGDSHEKEKARKELLNSSYFVNQFLDHPLYDCFFSPTVYEEVKMIMPDGKYLAAA